MTREAGTFNPPRSPSPAPPPGPHRDNIVTPWSEYAKEEWERMGIILDPDPRTADEEPWEAEPRLRIPAEDLCSVSIVGLVMLVCAFALGLAVGLVLR